MGSPLRDGALTVWAKGTRARSVYGGCRVEWSDGLRAADVGPRRSRRLRAWVFGPCAAAPGDLCAPGACCAARPQDVAYVVESVEEFRLGGALHHVEVTAG